MKDLKDLKLAVVTIAMTVTIAVSTSPVLLADDGDNIVWGTIADNIVWGTSVVLALLGF